MKRFLLILVLAVLATIAFAQAGYYDLSYGQSYSSARKTLENKGFLMINNQSVLKKYAIDPATDVYLVDLIINPEDNTLAGWGLYFNDGLSDEAQIDIANRFMQIHGEAFRYNEELGLVTWEFPQKRSLVIAMKEDGTPNLALYFDENYNSIFELSETQNQNWREINRQYYDNE